MARQGTTAPLGEVGEGREGELHPFIREALEGIYELDPSWKKPRSAVARGLRKRAAEINTQAVLPRTVQEARRLLAAWLPVVRDAVQQIVVEWDKRGGVSEVTTEALQIAVFKVNYGEKQPATTEDARAFLLQAMRTIEIDIRRRRAAEDQSIEDVIKGDLPPPADEEGIRQTAEDMAVEVDIQRRLIDLSFLGLAEARGPYAQAWRAAGGFHACRSAEERRRLLGVILRRVLFAIEVIREGANAPRLVEQSNTRHRNTEFEKIVRPVLVKAGMTLSDVAALIRVLAIEVWPGLRLPDPEANEHWAGISSAACKFVRWIAEVAGTKARRNSRLSEAEFKARLPKWRDLATLWLIGAPGVPGVVDIKLVTQQQYIEVKANPKRGSAANDPLIKPDLDKIADFIRGAKKAALLADKDDP